MTKKLSSWTPNQPLVAIDMELIKMKLISVKGDKQNQCKYLSVKEYDQSFCDLFS